VKLTTTKHYTHTDHLGGTNVVTNDEGEVVQSLDYYPFGSDRINTGSFSEQRTFIGEEHDPESNLNYLNARYYDSTRGQFMSQDPVFIHLGVDERTEQVLMDPQLHDPYGYGRNNPLIVKDPEGEFAILPVIGVILGAVFTVDTFADPNSSNADKAASGLEPFVRRISETGGRLLLPLDAWDRARIQASTGGGDRTPIDNFGVDNIIQGTRDTFPGISNFYDKFNSSKTPTSPQTVTQNGVIYTRNSDGLLNVVDDVN